MIKTFFDALRAIGKDIEPPKPVAMRPPPPPPPPTTPKPQPETPLTKELFVRIIAMEAKSDDPLLQQLAAALWDEEQIPPNSHSPMDQYIRVRKSPDWTVAIAGVAKLWHGYKTERHDFWHHIFYKPGEKGSGTKFLRTQIMLAGGYKPDPTPLDVPPELYSSPASIFPEDIRKLVNERHKYESYEAREQLVDDLWEQNQKEWKDWTRIQERFAKQVADTHAEFPLGRAQARLERLSLKLYGDDLMREFLEGTPLRLLFKEPEPEPVEIVDELAYSGTWICATHGYGKTSLLAKLCLDLMEKPCSIIVFDPKPELATWLREYRFPKKTVVIEPHPNLALNPLDLGTHNLSIFMHLFSALGASFTPRQSQVLSQAVYLASQVPNSNFETFKQVINFGAKGFEHIVETFDSDERVFWDSYDREYKDAKGEINWRLRSLAGPGSITRSMFAADKTRCKMQPLMDSNTLTIVECNKLKLSNEQVEFMGRMFLAMILAAGDQRAASNRKFPCHVILDEADLIISRATDVSEMIHRLRAQKVAIYAAHQQLTQIDEPKVLGALSDCAIRYVNAKDEAPHFAQRMGMDTETIRSLQRGEFALSLNHQPAQKVKMPLPDFSRYPKATDADLEERRATFVRDFCYMPKVRVPAISEPSPPPAKGAWSDKPTL